jgi:type VI secretion system protein ImpK
VQVLEVYYLCLSLGFEGRYRVEGHDRLRNIVQDLGADLEKVRKGQQGLSPPPPAEQGGLAGELRRNLPPWVALAVSGALLVMLYSGYAIWLHKDAGKITFPPVAIEETQ